MQLSSALPVAMMFFKHWHIDDTEAGIVIVKAALQRHPDGSFRAGPPPDWQLADIYAGDPAWTHLLAEQDIAPGKELCDLTIAAVARTPGLQPRRDWPVGVAVDGRLTYGFHIRGPALWQRQAGRWTLPVPAPVAEVPVTWALAYGGHAPAARDDAPPDVFAENPAGTGFANRRRLDGQDPFPAPQIGDLAEFIAADPGQPMMAHGLGPVAKTWAPRRALAGTFDQAWRDLRHPRMPYDYALRFWNAAPRPLQVAGLQGGDVVRLTGVSSHLPQVVCPLPQVRLWFAPTGGTAQVMTMDTVQIDVTADDPAAHRMVLIWRTRIADPGAITEAEILSEDVQPQNPEPPS